MPSSTVLRRVLFALAVAAVCAGVAGASLATVWGRLFYRETAGRLLDGPHVVVRAKGNWVAVRYEYDVGGVSYTGTRFTDCMGFMSESRARQRASAIARAEPLRVYYCPLYPGHAVLERTVHVEDIGPHGIGLGFGLVATLMGLGAWRYARRPAACRVRREGARAVVDYRSQRPITVAVLIGLGACVAGSVLAWVMAIVDLPYPGAPLAVQAGGIALAAAAAIGLRRASFMRVIIEDGRLTVSGGRHHGMELAGVSAVRTVESSPGVHQLRVAGTSPYGRREEVNVGESAYQSDLAALAAEIRAQAGAGPAEGGSAP